MNGTAVYRCPGCDRKIKPFEDFCGTCTKIMPSPFRLDILRAYDQVALAKQNAAAAIRHKRAAGQQIPPQPETRSGDGHCKVIPLGTAAPGGGDAT